MGAVRPDIFRHSASKQYHRPHFWLPPFFSNPFDNTPHNYRATAGGLQALVGHTIGSGTPKSTTVTADLATCLKECYKTNGNVVTYTNEGECKIYTNAVTQAMEPVYGMKFFLEKR